MLIALSLALLTSATQADAPDARRQTQAHIVLRSSPDGQAGLARDADGFVSREAFLAPLANAFARLDKDGDGRLSPDELSGGVSDNAGEVMFLGGAAGGAGAGSHSFSFRRSDQPAGGGSRTIVTTRGDGPRSVEEIAAEVIGGSGDVVIVRRDGDQNSGRVTLRRSSQGEGGGPRGEPRVMVLPAGRGFHGLGAGDGEAMNLDADGDGRVSEEEFLARFRETFRRMDSDGSGHLEAAEREKMHVGVFERRQERRGDD